MSVTNNFKTTIWCKKSSNENKGYVSTFGGFTVEDIRWYRMDKRPSQVSIEV